MKDGKASHVYWSGGDSFSSISDFRDAEEWVEDQLVDHVLQKLKELENV